MAEKELIKHIEKEEISEEKKEKNPKTPINNVINSSILRKNNASLSSIPLNLAPFPKSTKSAKSISSERTIQEFKAAKIDPIEKIHKEFEDLSDLEKNVLSIAEEILKQKRYKADIQVERVEMLSPLMEKLYSKCIARLTHSKGYSKEQIFQAIKSLSEKRWIVSDQRRTRREILGTKTLQQVLSFIHDYPGTHARDTRIEEVIGITRNPFIKHVMVLEAFGLVRSKKIGRTLNYFLANLPEIFDEFVVLFSNPLVVDIIKILLKEENIGLSEIARRLGVYHGAIQYHVKTLENKDILIKNEKGMHINRSLLKSYNDLYKIPPFGDFIEK
ncbi:winged helix-turn-helix transcriptional regulator [Candidatus Harpocratesius sp.]